MGNVFTQNIGNKITPFINDNENQCVICLDTLEKGLHPAPCIGLCEGCMWNREYIGMGSQSIA